MNTTLFYCHFCLLGSPFTGMGRGRDISSMRRRRIHRGTERVRRAGCHLWHEIRTDKTTTIGNPSLFGSLSVPACYRACRASLEAHQMLSALRTPHAVFGHCNEAPYDLDLVLRVHAKEQPSYTGRRNCPNAACVAKTSPHHVSLSLTTSFHRQDHVQPFRSAHCLSHAGYCVDSAGLKAIRGLQSRVFHVVAPITTLALVSVTTFRDALTIVTSRREGTINMMAPRAPRPLGTLPPLLK
ncbi:hypothetical protein MRB53_042243 [Persea americana]|nr:hypothetical protein MRB53_042243 [Persea americana]